MQIRTTANGRWSCFLPASTISEVTIQTHCNDLKSKELLTSNSDLKNANIDLTDLKAHFSLIKGVVKDCLGKRFNNSVLKLFGKNTEYYIQKNSSIDHWIPTCGLSTVSLNVENLLNYEEGNLIEWPVSEFIESGTWLACEMAKKPYFNLILNDQNKMFWELSTSLNPDGRMIIQAFENGFAKTPVRIYAPTDGPGTKPDNLLNIVLKDAAIDGKLYDLYCPTSTQGCGFNRFTITHFNYKNDRFIRGSFDGQFWVKSFNPLEAGYRKISGEFQLLKEF